MFKTFRLSFKIDSAISWNSFIYNLQQTPLLGRLIKNKWYGMSAAKTDIAILGAIKDFIWAVIRQFLYFAAFIGLPLVLVATDEKLTADGISNAVLNTGTVVFCWGFFILNILMGAFYRHALKSDYSDSSITKLIFMNLDPKEYYLSQTIYAYIAKFAFMLPAFALTAFLCDATFLQAAILYFGMFAVRVLADALYFTKLGYRLRSRRNGTSALTFIVFIAGMALYLTPLILTKMYGGNYLKTAAELVSGLPGLSGYILCGVAGILLIRRKADYDYLKKHELLEGEWQKMNLAEAETTKEITFRGSEAELTKEGSAAGKQGYEYLEAIFYERHRSLFKKRMRNFAVFVPVVMVVAAVIARMILKEESGVQMNRILGRVGIFIFLVYLLAYRDSYTKALFGNVDKYLLHYNWYRKPDVILKNYMIRLRRSFFMNFAMTAPLILSLIAATLIMGGSMVKALPALGVILILTLFYSVHYLTLYYLVQPYTEDLTAKNILYNISNFVIYFGSYMAMQQAAIGGMILIGVSVVMVIYLVVSVVLLQRLAPKTFKLR